MTQTSTPLHILLLEDSPFDAELIEHELRKSGLNFIAQRVETQQAFADALTDFLPDIVLSDYSLPGYSGLAALEMVLRDRPEIPVLIVTGALSDMEAVGLLDAGAQDYVLKDRLARLAPAVLHALLVKQVSKNRRLAEAQLQQKTALLENVINSSTDYIFVKDRELRTILCNQVFARALGKHPEELYGKTDIENGWDVELVKGNPEKGIRGFEQDDLAALAGNVVHSISDLGNVGGEIRHFDSVKVPLKFSNGEIFGMLGVSRDITERKQAEELLHFHSTILQNLAEGVSLVRASDGEIVFANPQFEQMFGYAPGELLGKHVSTINAAGEKDPQLMAAVIMGELERTGLWRGEIQNIRKDGAAFWCHANVSAFDHHQFGRVWVSVHQDISEHRKAMLALRESEELLRHAQEIAHIGHFKYDPAVSVVEGSDELFRIFGLTRESFHFSDFANSVHPDDRDFDVTTITSAIENKTGYDIEHRLLLRDGAIKWVRAIGETISSTTGGILLIGTVQDITERKKSEEMLRLTAKVFENTMEGITITDQDNTILEVNDAFTRITGYPREEAIGKTPRILRSGLQDQTFYQAMWQTIQATGHWRGDIWNRRKDGEIYPETITISAITDEMGKVTNYVGVFSDITLLKQHEKQLERIAHYDALTGIPNRVLLSDRLQQAIAFSKREKKLLAVCYLDLDGFKTLNDSLGHEAGDQVLIDISRRIKGVMREGDTVARIGGDEFVILLAGLDAPEECTGSLNRLLDAVAQPIILKGKAFKVSGSIGVSLYPLDDSDPDILLRHADQAMYTAKQSGRNRYFLYDPGHDQRARNYQEFLQHIRHGLAKSEFELFFQPKVDLRSWRIVGAEGLIRWRHPERGLLSPAEFLPAIEDTELDVAVGEWVLAAALEQIRQWQQVGMDLELSINISAFHMQSPEFREKLQRLLAFHPNLPSGSLQIEILETAALKDISAATQIIESCRSMGIGFALDDFGTGYSSLSYLSNLPVDTLKIDQSFIRDMLDDRGDFAIVQGIIALSKAFSLKTVAEGVETNKCFEALLDIGCDIGQGYAIAHPMPAGDFLAWYKHNRDRK